MILNFLFLFFFFLFFFFAVGSEFPAPHLSLKLSFPAEPEPDAQHRDDLCEVRMEDLAKRGHTHTQTHNPSLLSRLPPSSCRPSPGTYLQVQVVGRHGNCRRVRAICIVSAFISKTMSLSIQYRYSCLFARSSLPDCPPVFCPSACLSVSLLPSSSSAALLSLFFPAQPIRAPLLHHSFICHICFFLPCTAGPLHAPVHTLFRIKITTTHTHTHEHTHIWIYKQRHNEAVLI